MPQALAPESEGLHCFWGIYKSFSKNLRYD